jgi:hypothetical protein
VLDYGKNQKSSNISTIKDITAALPAFYSSTKIKKKKKTVDNLT